MQIKIKIVQKTYKFLFALVAWLKILNWNLYNLQIQENVIFHQVFIFVLVQFCYFKTMGASQHKEADSPKPELPPYQDTTPPREPCIPKRQLPFDPRSPTDNIARTPIIVDKTPETFLSELDPRSPTVGVERTPLSILLRKGTASAQCLVLFNFKLYKTCV